MQQQNIQVQMPDGSVLEFPAGTSDEVIDKAAKDYIANMKSGSNGAQQAAEPNMFDSPRQVMQLINKSEVAPNIGDYFEPVSKGAVNYAATMLNGIYSAPQAIFGGDSAYQDAEQFASRQKIIDELTMPKTKLGKDATEAIGWIAEKLRVPVSGYAGIADLIMNQDLDSAVNSINAVNSGEKTLGDVLGDANYEATSDPIWAAAVKTFADGIPDLLGASYVQKPLLTKRLDKKAEKLIEQLDAGSMNMPQNGVLANVSPADIAKRQLVEIDDLRNEKRRIDAQTMQMLSDEMKRDPEFARSIVNTLKSKPDEAAKKVIQQGASKGSVANLKATNPSTRKVMRKMLATANNVLNDESLAAAVRPAMAVGDVVNRRVKFLDNKRKDVGLKIRASLGQFDNKPIPLEQSDPIARRFLGKLEDMGIEFNDDSFKPIFDNSSVRDIPSFRKLIEKTMQDLSSGRLSPKDLHFFKKRLDQSISYNKTTDGLAGELENALQGLRGDINDYLGNINPAYREANRSYSEIKTALDNAQSALGIKKKLKVSGADADEYEVAQIGNEMRKVLSRYGKANDIRYVLKEIENTAKNYNLDDKVQVDRLIAFENMLDEMMPSLIPRSFKSQVASGVDSARIVAEPREAMRQKAAQWAGDKWDDMRGINESNASRALQRMLDELDKNN